MLVAESWNNHGMRHSARETSMAAALSERDWQLRLHIYQFLVEHTRPPTVGESAEPFRDVRERGA